MTGPFQRFVLLVTLCALQSACSLGYNRMLFMTKTNVGLDMDTKPPTAEVSIARREGFIGPSFEEGKALPVLGSFRFEGNWLSPNISAAFAGGKAAVTLAKLFGDMNQTLPPTGLKSKICLSHPLKDPSQGILSEEGLDARPLFFATDTTFGLKVAWSGATEAIPDSVKMGYNRKEFAYAPVFGRQVQGTAIPDPVASRNAEDEPCRAGEYEIQIPSFIATIDNSQRIGPLTGTNLTHVQFFATGEAANALALRPEIRKVLEVQLVPQVLEDAVTRRTNRQLMKDIRRVFEDRNTTDETRAKIISKAAELDLVDRGTTSKDFISSLAANEGRAKSEELEQLKKYAQQP